MIEKRYVEISTGIIFRTILILLAVWFVYAVRDIIALLFISILIVTAIEPAVDFLQRKKIHRSLGVLIVYFVLFSIIALTFSFLIPPMAYQLKDFGQKANIYLENFGDSLGNIRNFFRQQNIDLDLQKITESLNDEIFSFSGRIFTETVNVFSGFISVLVIFVITFYMSLREDGIKRFIVSITPDKHKEYAVSLTQRVKIKIGKWMQGQFFLMFTIFILDFFGLYFLKIPYALTLAVFAGLMEIIPYVGPIVSAIPGVILGFTISPITGFFTLLLYIVVQQFENHIIVPQIMKKALGLNPIAVILALLVGLKLGGILGAILSIPFATAIGVFIGDLIEKPKETA